MTVTRCSIRLDSGEVGHGYVQGRDKRKAELAAVFDALLQTADRGEALRSGLIEALGADQRRRRQVRSRKAASTKVEFFTMVRGEDPK